MTGRLLKTGLAVALGCATLAGSMTPTYAGDRGGAIAAGVIGGAALGALAAGAINNGYGYPPPPPPPRYVEPAYAPPPPRCHRELVRFWDEDEGVYVERPRRVCDRY